MILDSEATYKAYDKEQIGLGIRRLPEQIGIAWDGTRALSLPANYNGCTNVVLVGMGGSALGSHILESVFFSRIKVPFTIVRGYSVPASVTSKTLVILSSFSGSTEEVLSAAIEAKKVKAKI
ncbi:MAG: bifunctional phosphoglucose/phosphomannose isomerase, partial [Candidatus Uhrbacteria bacterium]|nr:bifunctional phosphoglucose/phosphomannose isomerase [Candidatus Uhrbacteria bacterium]